MLYSMLCLGLRVKPSGGFKTAECIKFRYKIVEMVKSVHEVLEYKDVCPPGYKDPATVHRHYMVWYALQTQLNN